MSSQMQAFGSWRIILLNSDDLGDDGDVLTRVGANAAAFLPAGGGGNPFDQDLNTDDDVVFASVELSGPLLFPVDDAQASTGDIRSGVEFSIYGQHDDSGLVDHKILSYSNGSLEIGQTSGAQDTNIYGRSFNLTGDGVGIFATTLFGIEISTTDLRIDLSPGTGPLNINGTPGVTDAAIVVDGVTLSFTKGILTGVA